MGALIIWLVIMVPVSALLTGLGMTLREGRATNCGKYRISE